MTEYDFSQDAYRRHVATQTRVSNWVTQTEEQRSKFGSAFELKPGVSRSGISATSQPQLVDLPKSRPISPRRFRSSDSLRSFVLCQERDLTQWQGENTVPLNGLPRSHSSHHVRSQPQSRSSSRHHSPSRHQALQAQNTNQPAGHNVAVVPKYVYAPAGSRVVIIPPNGQNVSVVVSTAFIFSYSFVKQTQVLFSCRQWPNRPTVSHQCQYHILAARYTLPRHTPNQCTTHIPKPLRLSTLNLPALTSIPTQSPKLNRRNRDAHKSSIPIRLIMGTELGEKSRKMEAVGGAKVRFALGNGYPLHR